MLIPASAEERRFLLALALALLIHIALGVLLSHLPKESEVRSKEARVLQVTLNPAAPAQGAQAPGPELPARELSARELPAREPQAPEGQAPKLPAPDSPAPTAPTQEAPARDESPSGSAGTEEPPAELSTLHQAADTPEVEASDAATPVEPTAATESAGVKAPEPSAAESPEVEAPVKDVAPRPATMPRRRAPAPGGGRPRRAAAAEGIPAGAAGAGNQGRGGSGLPTLEPSRYVAPEYPEVARQAGWTGMVVLELTIGRRGRVMEVELRESSGHEPLDAAAMRAVGLWRFPRRNEGSRSLHHFEFRLE